MAEFETGNCIGCGGTLHEIKVIDKGHYNQTLPVEYAALDAKASLWTGKLPVDGAVKSFMCSDCGLIKQFGVPK
jgi:hypothetical protein